MVAAELSKVGLFPSSERLTFAAPLTRVCRLVAGVGLAAFMLCLLAAMGSMPVCRLAAFVLLCDAGASVLACAPTVAFVGFFAPVLVFAIGLGEGSSSTLAIPAGLAKTPYCGSQSKYRSPPTEPSFFP